MLAAADAARASAACARWALTGPRAEPARRRRATTRCASTSPHTATVQEVHLVALHLLCAAVDEAPLGAARSALRRGGGSA